MAKPLMTLTDSAAAQVKTLMAAAPKDTPVLGVRVGVTDTGCSGKSYSMEYVTAENPLDMMVEDKGVKVFIDPAAQIFLIGTEMDYNENAFESGFSFNNPNATGHCGCGKSFSTQ